MNKKKLNNEQNDTNNEKDIDENNDLNKKDLEKETEVETDLQNKLDLYSNQISELKDEKLRLLAEMDNIRKRADRERQDSFKYGCSDLAREILSTNDNLTRALENIPKDKKQNQSTANLIKGLEMVQKEFLSILEKFGIKKINSLNQKFDPNLHQAMLEVETEDVEQGVVVQEIQSGYKIYEKLLRPSMVGVSKKKQKPDQKDNK
ncbi:MAG: Protein GrpE [Alphaproteobacteria bacterium MarineAlpha5_Bin9]|nr:MAG: Protein GrpE [Alphaproteobacteria bacterium MarineAlpha5_Bin9]|tara:strand:+ start:10358 stop:10972 length:615 start_codon:yes stop_codon:yes gene_type:complete